MYIIWTLYVYNVQTVLKYFYQNLLSSLCQTCMYLDLPHTHGLAFIEYIVYIEYHIIYYYMFSEACPGFILAGAENNLGCQNNAKQFLLSPKKIPAHRHNSILSEAETY